MDHYLSFVANAMPAGKDTFCCDLFEHMTRTHELLISQSERDVTIFSPEDEGGAFF
jgi:hypothetical protein